MALQLFFLCCTLRYTPYRALPLSHKASPFVKTSEDKSEDFRKACKGRQSICPARPECFCPQKCIEGSMGSPVWNEMKTGVKDFTPFVLKPLNLTFFMTPVVYDEHFSTIVLFPREPVFNTLKDVLAEHGKTIFTIAETEKYAHVTYFFRGENEDTVTTETRTMISSIIAQNYINNPCMSAHTITDAVLTALQSNEYDFYVMNYANADMVGHSGNLQATIAAVECLDEQLKRLYDVIVQEMNGTLYITADHGKAEQMYDEISGQTQTAHTNNPVPFIMIQKGCGDARGQLPLTQLSQVAPFILNKMGLPVPTEMKQ